VFFPLEGSPDFQSADKCQEAGTATTDGRRRNRAGTRSDNGPTEEKAELARIRCRMGTVKGRGPCNWLRKQHIKTGW
jgi:hypothetical protein